MKKRTIVKKVAILVLFGIILSCGVVVYKTRDVKNQKKAIITTGVTKGQEEYFQEKLSEAVSYEKIIQRAKLLKEQGKYDEAIKVFEEAFEEAKWQGDKGSIVLSLADVYEKKRNYKKALEYVIKNRDEYVNDWAKGPIVERAKYLEYASKGEYELAVIHANNTMVEYVNIFKDGRQPREDYIERLNDLKASKEYIENLKPTEE